MRCQQPRRRQIQGATHPRISGTARWQGGFEPFGRDFSGASDAGVFLRFPGQWVDGAWEKGSSGSIDSYYNVFRWYEPQNGRYLAIDPYLWNSSGRDYRYALNNPVGLIDPLGLFSGERTADQATVLIRAINEDLDCIEKIRDEVRARSENNRFKHCLGNCLITKNCPSKKTGAYIASLFKEFSDIFRCIAQRRGGNCNSAFQPSDFEDNELGRNCPAPASCEVGCEDLKDTAETPGPFGIISPERVGS